MRGLEAARRDFRKHRREEERVGFTHERESNRRIGAEFLLEIDRRKHAVRRFHQRQPFDREGRHL